MGYREIRRESKNFIMVDQHVSMKHGAPGMKRSKKRKATPEDVAKINAWNKRRNALWRIHLYFNENDFFVTLTYKKEERPEDMVGAKKDFKLFREKLRRFYKKNNTEMRWIRNIEIGSKKAVHIHMIINRIDGLDAMIRKLWKKGNVNFQLLYKDGGYKDLAKYITKSPVTDKSLKESDYQTSRNMPLPEPKVKDIKGWDIHRKITVPKGWMLDKDSLVNGVNPLTGFEYRHYMLIRCG